MIFYTKDSLWPECEKLGEAAVRAKVDAGDYGEQSALPRQWLLERAEQRRARTETEDHNRNERALAASEASARASEKAAQAAQKSARWTMLAAIAAFLAAIVPVIVQFLCK